MKQSTFASVRAPSSRRSRSRPGVATTTFAPPYRSHTNRVITLEAMMAAQARLYLQRRALGPLGHASVDKGRAHPARSTDILKHRGNLLREFPASTPVPRSGPRSITTTRNATDVPSGRKNEGHDAGTGASKLVRRELPVALVLAAQDAGQRWHAKGQGLSRARLRDAHLQAHECALSSSASTPTTGPWRYDGLVLLSGNAFSVGSERTTSCPLRQMGQVALWMGDGF
eukprot:scaffold1549_cov350-Prasinococcus_capsulatus_cf.AAC.21